MIPRLEIDINCDMGEGMANDATIMPFISSANIACGYHAGNEKTLWDTISLAKENKVAVGAHVSFLDRANFGRSEMVLPVADIYELVIQQLIIIQEIADSFEMKLHHVKPHGALYNMAAKDAGMAKAIAEAVRDFDHKLIIYGRSNSLSINEAAAAGLKAANEVFADRAYLDDGNLAPRSQKGALIEDSVKATEQVLQMVNKKTVITRSGKEIPIKADTICIHGDNEHAAVFAKSIFETLKQNQVVIKAF
jgi:5-oxoprolinase (ATP-hydrolysing) subunit A